MLGISDNPVVLLILANVILLIAGMFLESTAAIMILTPPILLPPLMASGVNPVHFGLVMVFNLMIGMITPPPVGMSVYMLSPIVKLPVGGKVFKAVLPYLFSLLVALVVLTYVPQISLWLPSLLFN